MRHGYTSPIPMVWGRNNPDSNVMVAKLPVINWVWPLPSNSGKYRFRFGFPTKKGSCHPGGHWHPGKGPYPSYELKKGSTNLLLWWDYILFQFLPKTNASLLEERVGRISSPKKQQKNQGQLFTAQVTIFQGSWFMEKLTQTLHYFFGEVPDNLPYISCLFDPGKWHLMIPVNYPGFARK